MASDMAQRTDQFDIRLNVPSDEWLELFLIDIDDYCRNNNVRYLHVSGIEIGDVPGRSSFGQQHVHIALILQNYTSKRSIVNKFVTKGQGYYIEPRDKKKRIDGWIAYHSKSRTKINPGETLIYKYGSLPRPRLKRESPEDLTPLEAAKKKQKAMDWSRKKYLMRSGS